MPAVVRAVALCWRPGNKIADVRMAPSDVVLAGSPQLLPHVFSRLITGLLLSHCLSTASRGGFDCRVLLYCDARQQHLELPLLASSGAVPVCWIPAGALTSLSDGYAF